MEIDNQKRCTKCGRAGPFYKNRTNKDGLSKWCKSCDNESAKKWQKNNPDKRKEIVNRSNNKRKYAMLLWSRVHADIVRERNNIWRLNNLDKANAKTRRYRTKKAGGGGSHTAEEFLALCSKFNNRCAICGKQKKLEADHIIPVSRGGSSDISNIQPLCRSCNARKNNK